MVARSRVNGKDLVYVGWVEDVSKKEVSKEVSKEINITIN